MPSGEPQPTPGADRARDGQDASEARLRIATAAPSLIVAEVDRDLRYVWIHNPHPDFDPSQVLGKRDDELDESPEIAELLRLKREVVRRGRPLRCEWSVQRSDGRHYYDLHLDPRRGPQGDVTGVLSAALDITERRRAEVRAGQELEITRRLLAAAGALNEALELDEVLRALTAILLEVLEHTRAGVYLWDAERREATLVASAGTQALPPGMKLPFDQFSTATQKVIEACRTTVVDYDVLSLSQRGAAARFGSHTSLQVPLVRHDKLVGLVILDDPGERREFSERERELAEGIAADAAVAIENARLIETSRSAEIRLRATFESAPVGIVIGDLDGRVVATNRRFDEMLGYEDGETIDQPLSDFTFAEEMLRENRLLGEMTIGRRESYELTEKRFVRKDGSVIWVSVSASLVREDGGEPQFVIAVAEDITEQRRTREALEEKDAAIRSAYVDVISAVTGGKLLLMASEELTASLGRPVSVPQPASKAGEITEGRHRLGETLRQLEHPVRDADGLLLAATEALTNAWKHGVGAQISVRTTDDAVQVVVLDEGPGIDFKTLPKATLTAGFSTTVSLGMGFTIMLDVCDRVLLATEPGFTAVVLEMDAEPR